MTGIAGGEERDGVLIEEIGQASELVDHILGIALEHGRLLDRVGDELLLVGRPISGHGVQVG